jgi:hypothetical protein
LQTVVALGLDQINRRRRAVTRGHLLFSFTLDGSSGRARVEKKEVTEESATSSSFVISRHEVNHLEIEAQRQLDYPGITGEDSISIAEVLQLRVCEVEIGTGQRVHLTNAGC